MRYCMGMDTTTTAARDTIAFKADATARTHGQTQVHVAAGTELEVLWSATFGHGAFARLSDGTEVYIDNRAFASK